MRNPSAEKNRPRRSTAIGAAIIVFGLLATSLSAAAQTISLGAAEKVAVLGASTVNNGGPTVVIGNLALSSPGVSVTGFPPGTIVAGSIHIGDALANQAHADAATAYTQLVGEASTTILSGQDLGTLAQPLTPGVYYFAASAALNGTLRLDTQGDPNAAFHFQIGTTLTTGVGSQITLLNGNSVNIFWQVGTSATIGVNSTFYGNIIADQSITINSGATINGRAMAINAAVTMDTNTINGFNTGSVWKGNASDRWSGANWSPDVSGATSSSLAANADVVFSTTGAVPLDQNTVLDLATTISSLTVNDSVAVTISGANTLSISGTGATTGITINSGAGLATINSNLVLSGSSQTMTVSNSAGFLINGSVGGTIGLTKAGTGTLTLAGSNTYTGTTTINAGTLNAGAAGSLGGTSSIVINAGGTLLLSQPGSATTDRINNSSTMTLNGGTFNTAGLSEHNLSGATITPGIGALPLSSNSILDLGAGASILAFANSSAQTWSGTLSIYNWSGTPVVGKGTDQLYFGTDSTGLTATQLSQIAFYSDSGTTFLGAAGFVSGLDGELGPVPEPATWFAAALGAGAIAWSKRRRFAQTFFGRRKRIVILITGAVFVVAFSAPAVASEDFPEIGKLDHAAIFSPPGGASIDQAAHPLGLGSDVVTAGNGSDRLFASQSIGSYTTVNLRKNQNITVSGAPGETVALSLTNFIMTGSSTFTLQGAATTSFVINVNQQFSLSGSARIILSGGVQWNHVVFNVLGKGSVVTLRDVSSLTGILNANDRTVRMTDQARVYGQVNAKKLQLLEHSRIIEPPVVSPEQPP